MPKVLSSGAEFHDFEAKPIFIGYLGDAVIREKDAAVKEGEVLQDSQKAGAVMGWLFNDIDTDEETIIGSSASIEKSITDTKNGVKAGDCLYIEFLGKRKTSSGKPFNAFRTELWTVEDIEKHKAKTPGA